MNEENDLVQSLIDQFGLYILYLRHKNNEDLSQDVMVVG